jgi:signal transduction histidine kinase
MQPARANDRRRRTTQLDVLMLATAGILLVATLLPQFDPDLNIVMKDRTLDVALSALTLVAVAGLAVLSFIRYRETGRLASFVQSSAYALWASYMAATMLLIVFKLDSRLGMSLSSPEQWPVWVAAGVRTGIAGLFMLSGIAAFMGVYGGTRRRVRNIFLPVVVIGLLAIFLYPIRDLLPPLIEEAGIQVMLSPDQADMGILPGITGLALAMVIAAVGALLAAIVLYRLTWGRGGPTSDAFTALGLVILLVAEVQNALWPSVYSPMVTIADIMRLVAYTVMVAGAIADQRSDLRALRSAYTALDRMRVNDAERAALEERARLAREIHDGLAQHLWFAKLKFERLAGGLSEADQPLAAEVTQALDAAIVEAREALVTMRASVTEDVPFADMLQRTIDDFEDRSGLRVELSMPTGLPAALAPRVQVELLRIVSEALTNVHKHADATTVRIAAEVGAGELLITITDNGHGFVPDEGFDHGLGLRGMRERARLISGNLLVMSELSGGTTVEMRVPVTASGIGSVSETAEWTAMARDVGVDDEDAQLDIPDLDERGGAGTAPVRGPANAPDIAAKGMQP